MDYFEISTESCTIGFQEHVNLHPNLPVGPQLRRREIYHRSGPDKGQVNELKKIIEKNSSLRVDFGWSFESSRHYETIIQDCIDVVFPKYITDTTRPFGHLVSDLRCSWLGFVPFDIFEQAMFENMSIAELITFNDELLAFQIEVVEFIVNHEIFKQHTLLRNAMYKFEYFKEARKDPDALVEAYRYYMNAIHDACMLTAISRDLLEMEIGCHFLQHPDLFMQLLEISILQGTVYE